MQPLWLIHIADSDSQYSQWNRDPSLDLCNVNLQCVTVVAKSEKPSESESESKFGNVKEPLRVTAPYLSSMTTFLYVVFTTDTSGSH